MNRRRGIHYLCDATVFRGVFRRLIMGTNRFKRAARRAGMALAAVHLAAGYALAQGGNSASLNKIKSALGQTNSDLKGFAQIFTNIVLTGLGLFFIVQIVNVGYKVGKGDQDAGKKLAYYIGAMALVGILFALVNAVFF